MTTVQDAERVLATQQHRSRMKEDDPAYMRLRDATQRRLSASLQRLVRELRGAHPTEQHTALSDFISRQTAILQDAYIAAHNAGASDYFGEVSQTPQVWAKRSPVDPDKMRRTLSFYAPSIAKMAHEALAAVNAAPGVHLEEVIDESVKLGFFSGFSRVTSGMRGALGGVGNDPNHTLYSAHGHHFAGRAPGEHNEANIHEHLAAQHHGEGASHGGGKASAKITHEDIATSHAALHGIFGRALSDHEIGSLVGARTGDEVRLHGAYAGNDFHKIEIKVTGANGSYTAERLLSAGRDGIIMRNLSLEVTHTGDQLGTQIFARQVQGLTRLGVVRIATEAGGSGDGALARRPSGEYNGYYTWARLGYNGKPPSLGETAKILQSRLSRTTGLENASTVRDIMKTARVVYHPPLDDPIHMTGAQWWRRFGIGFVGTFDLTPGSESHQILDAYLAERGIVIDMSERQSSIRLDETTTGHEEIEWTDEDEAAAERAWQRLFPDLAETENDDAARIE